MTAFPPEYQIIAFRLGSTKVRQPWQNYMQFDPNATPQTLDFMFFAIVAKERVVLVDTGFSPSAGARSGMPRTPTPTECLVNAGIAPGRVSDIVITHLHWDHAGGLDDFPKATVHLQEQELGFATGPCMCDPFLRRPFESEDVASAVRALYQGRMRLHNGNVEVAPGITLYLVGGHTAGLQVVRVNTARGAVVLAGDAAHTWQNLRNRNPFPVLLDVAKVMAGFRLVEALADGPDHIIPGHDPLVAVVFPPLPGVEGAFLVHASPTQDAVTQEA